MPGYIDSYIHGNEIGALVELRCSDDFALKTDEFRTLAKNLCMQVAASSPRALTVDALDPEFRESELGWTRRQIENLDPEERLRRMADAQERLGEFCLLSQPFIQDLDKSVEDEIQRVSAELKVPIEVVRFERWDLSEA